MSPSLRSPRGFSPDGRTFSPGGLATRVKGSNWKHPIDSDNGGPDDPPKKTPKGPTQTGGNDTWKDHCGYYHPDHSKGWYDKYGHYHPGKNSDGGTASNGEPAPAARHGNPRGGRSANAGTVRHNPFTLPLREGENASCVTPPRIAATRWCICMLMRDLP